MTGRRYLAAGLFWLLVIALPGDAAAQGEAVPCSPEPGEATLSYGAVVQCGSEVVGDVDLFRFRGAPGEVAVARLSGVDHCIRTLRPNGTVLVNATCGSLVGQPIGATLDARGVFVIEVVGRSAGTTYRLALDQNPPFSRAARPLCAFCTLADSIDPAEDFDTFVFDAAAGETVKVTGVRRAGGSPCVTLYDPTGRLFRSGSCSGTGTSQIDPVVVTVSGRYTVVVAAQSLTDYTIRLECSGSCQAPPRECRVVVTDASYANGETVMADVVLRHRDPVARAVEVKIWLERPSGERAIGLLNVGGAGDIQLPAGYNNEVHVTVGTVEPSLPRGLYRLGCRMVDPISGLLLSETISPFTIR